MKRLLAAFGGALLVSGNALLAHEGATGIVKQRMDEMEQIGRAVKRINDRLELNAVWLTSREMPRRYVRQRQGCPRYSLPEAATDTQMPRLRCGRDGRSSWQPPRRLRRKPRSSQRQPGRRLRSRRSFG